MRRIDSNPTIEHRKNPTPIIRRRKDFTNYDNTKHLHKSAAKRSDIIEDAINENFVGKVIGVYSKDSFVSGICEKYVGGVLFMRKAHYQFMSDSVDFKLEGDSDCIALEKMGKSIVLLNKN